jgi:hypothetical protein
MNAAQLLNSVVAALAEVRLEAILSQVIARKRAAGRPRDKAALEALEATLRQKSKRPSQRAAALAALRHESERALVELIRRRLALPVEKRMNFLRVRLPGGGSHL